MSTRMEAYIILGRRLEDNIYQGVIENAWFMGLSPERACIFFTNRQLGVDGKENAEHYRAVFAKNRPEFIFEIYQIGDPNMPVILDLDQWHRDNIYTPDTLSGVRNKFRARNALFKMK